MEIEISCKLSKNRRLIIIRNFMTKIGDFMILQHVCEVDGLVF